MLIELRESNDLAMRLEFFLRKTNSTLISLFSFVITFFCCCYSWSSSLLSFKFVDYISTEVRRKYEAICVKEIL